MNLALKLLLIKKISYLNTLRLFPTQNRKRTLKELRNSYIWLLTYRLFYFYRKRGFGPDQSHYNQSRLWCRLHTTLAQITWITPKWIYIKYTALKLFTVQDFWATFACPEKQSCPEIFHCIEYIFNHSGFLRNLRLSWKQRLPWNFSNREAAALWTIFRSWFP